MMKFYIVTPSYNALRWLQGCVRSVTDQVGDSVEVHHHIKDGGSTDGTVEWLKNWQQEHAELASYKLTFESARDAGLYHAINMAWKKLPADAEVTAHLNADEQYLPGALAAIAAEMQQNPAADMLLCSYIVLDKDMRYICHRRPTFPNKTVSRAITQIVTNACFYRAASFAKWGIYFDCSFRSLADLVFFRDILAKRPQILRMPDLFGCIFVVTGGNVSWSEVTANERKRISGELPLLLRKLIPLFVKGQGLWGIVYDYFRREPRGYDIYIADGENRTSYSIKHPTHWWNMRSTGES